MKTRNTIQKDLVERALQVLMHPSADDVYAEVVKEHPNISRATVYRILGQMEKLRQLRRIMIPGTADRFDTVMEPHYHVYCRVCGGVSDAALPYQEQFGEFALDANGFLIEGHGVYMWGVCASCRAKGIIEEEPALA
jgi:Fe2+ or Zn2+ uptake regulation protein